jgi:hypothetical protein
LTSHAIAAASADISGRASLDQFGFFFGFYGLILGLAVTELLKGLGKLARAGSLRKLGWQTGLLALFLLLVICATWIDAWDSLRGVALNFAGLWGPVLIAIIYYLAATITFPEHPDAHASLDDYFAKRKRDVAILILLAEFVVNYTYLPVYIATYAHNPDKFWTWLIPYNTVIKLVFIAFIFVRGKRANIAVLSAMILMFLLPYWQHH